MEVNINIAEKSEDESSARSEMGCQDVNNLNIIIHKLQLLYKRKMSCRIDLYTEFNFGIFIRYSILCCVVFLMNKASVEYSKTNFAFYVCTLFLFFIPCAPDAETWAVLLSKTLFFIHISLAVRSSCSLSGKAF